MRSFYSYGPIDREINYCVPRNELREKAFHHLIGTHPDKGGHYITVWAARQTGKSTLLRDVYWELLKNKNYYAANIDIQNLRDADDSLFCMNNIINKINILTGLKLPAITEKHDFETVFTRQNVDRPLILIIDEFDSLNENVISDFTGAFRNIYHARKKDPAPSPEKHYLLHGVALIGVRSVVGVDNRSGSPFNVQKSIHIHNLSETEVNRMYQDYSRETGQPIAEEVIERVFYVTRGHPGLVSWFGELLTQEYNYEPKKPITIEHWNTIYAKSLHIIPNNSIINIVSKGMAEEYRQTVLNLFKTSQKMIFEFEDPHINYLYMNGVIDYEETDGTAYVRFPGQFVQEKLFRRFARELDAATDINLLSTPFTDLTQIVNEREICLPRLLSLFQDYYDINRNYLLKHAQRRMDMRVTEAVYHFQLYSWLEALLRDFGWSVLPEFPTGNGKTDLLIKKENRLYGLELKSFSRLHILNKSIEQAAEYGRLLGLDVIYLVVFIDIPVPDEIKALYAEPVEVAEKAWVEVIFIITNS